MKKLVAISVLLAGLAAAVFAQDGGWSNAWKLGLSVGFTTDIFYTAKATGKKETTQTSTVSSGTISASTAEDDAAATRTTEYGKNAKGVSYFFPNAKLDESDLGGNRLILSLSNEGENYSLAANISTDLNTTGRVNWVDHEWNLWDFISKGQMLEDWGFRGNAGIFDATVGCLYAPGGWVDPVAPWGSLVDSNATYRFNVWRWSGDAGGEAVHSNHFRSLNYQWGEVFSVGMKLGDSFKFTLGYQFLDNWGKWDPAFISVGGYGGAGYNYYGGSDSKSAINGIFLLSGSPVDAINFDLFYAIQGKDDDTFALPGSVVGGYNDPTAKWKNILGAYVQVKGIENLSLSLGYTANFEAYEAGSFVDNTGDLTAAKKVNYNSPIYSGIDLRLGYSGIDKIGLKFINNVSFASAKGDKIEEDSYGQPVYKDKINLLFDQSPSNARKAEGETQSWFHLQSILSANLGFIDGVGLEVAFADFLGVYNDNTDKTVPQSFGSTTTVKTDSKATTTNNMFRAVAGAKYGVGNVTLGIALFFQLDSTIYELDKTVTTTSTGGSGTVKNTEKSNNDTVKFGVPITFSLSF